MNSICPVSEVYLLLIQQWQDNHHLNEEKYFCKYYGAKQHKLMNFQSQQQADFLNKYYQFNRNWKEKA